MPVERHLFEAAQTALVQAYATVRALEDADPEVLQEHYDEWKEEEVGVLADRTMQAYRALCLCLEVSGLPLLLADMKAGFQAFENPAALDWHSNDLASSPALSYIADFLVILAASFDDPTPQRARVEILRRIISNTEHIVTAAGVVPTKEIEVQKPLQVAISWAFPDVLVNPPIPQPSKVYKPDLGVPGERSAIEVKFVDSPTAGKAVLGELYTDMKGYEGDPAWTSFTAIIYQTGPHLRLDRIQAEARRVGVPKSWEVFLVTGPGGRTKPETAKPAAPKGAEDVSGKIKTPGV